MSRTPTQTPHLGLQASQREIINAVNQLLAKVDFASLTNAANDGAAATAGVSVGQLYRNGSTVCVRIV